MTRRGFVVGVIGVVWVGEEGRRVKEARSETERVWMRGWMRRELIPSATIRRF